MKITVTNRDRIEKCGKLPDDVLVISIYTPEDELPNVHASHMIQLCFDDITDTKYEKIDYHRKIQAMTEEQAMAILDFVNKRPAYIKAIIVNCDAGVSRSPGIAVALNEILNGDTKIPHEWELYNRLVYNRIIRYNSKLKEKKE